MSTRDPLQFIKAFNKHYYGTLERYHAWRERVGANVSRQIILGKSHLGKDELLAKYHASLTPPAERHERLCFELAFRDDLFLQDLESDEWFEKRCQALALIELLYWDTDEHSKLSWSVVLSGSLTYCCQFMKRKDRMRSDAYKEKIRFVADWVTVGKDYQHDTLRLLRSNDFNMPALLETKISALGEVVSEDKRKEMAYEFVTDLIRGHATAVGIRDTLIDENGTPRLRRDLSCEITGMLMQWGIRFSRLTGDSSQMLSSLDPESDLGGIEFGTEAFAKEILGASKEFIDAISELKDAANRSELPKFKSALNKLQSASAILAVPAIDEWNGRQWSFVYAGSVPDTKLMSTRDPMELITAFNRLYYGDDLEHYHYWTEQIGENVSRPVIMGETTKSKEELLKEFYESLSPPEGRHERLCYELAFRNDSYFYDWESDYWFDQNCQALALMEMLYQDADRHGKLAWSAIIAVGVIMWVYFLSYKGRHLSNGYKKQIQFTGDFIPPQSGHQHNTLQLLRSEEFKIPRILDALNAVKKDIRKATDPFHSGMDLLENLIYCHCLSLGIHDALSPSSESEEEKLDLADEVEGMLMQWGIRYGSLSDSIRENLDLPESETRLNGIEWGSPSFGRIVLDAAREYMDAVETLQRAVTKSDLGLVTEALKKLQRASATLAVPALEWRRQEE